MYRVAAEPEHDLLAATLGGLLSVAEVDEYIAALRRAFVHALGSPYRLIVDVRECPIQSQEMTRAMAEHMAAMPRAAAIAVVAGSSLARMQVRRLFTQPYARIVRDPAAARAWVLHGIEPPPG